MSGVNPVVCINSFTTDTAGEVKVIKRAVEATGARCAVSTHWAHGGEGALELADMIIDACKKSNGFQYLYPNEMKLRQRVEKIATTVYGADGVDWSPEAKAKAEYLKATRNTMNTAQ